MGTQVLFWSLNNIASVCVPSRDRRWTNPRMQVTKLARPRAKLRKGQATWRTRRAMLLNLPRNHAKRLASRLRIKLEQTNENHIGSHRSSKPSQINFVLIKF